MKPNPGPMWTETERLQVIEKLSEKLALAAETMDIQSVRYLSQRIYFVTRQTAMFLDVNRKNILEGLE